MRRIVVVQHEDDAGLDLMAGPLAEQLRGQPRVRVEVVRPDRGEALPEDAGDLAGLIVLGGEMGALDDDVAPWLPATRALMADAVSRETPLLGVCLGAQLLAAATGGRAERGSNGLELGLAELRPLPAARDDGFMRQVLDGVSGELGAVLQYHRDAVTELPPDAELLVTGDQYPHQVFRVGAAAWGVQYHPEVSGGAFDVWLRSADVEDPPRSAAVRAELAARPELAGRPALARSHATALLHAATLVP